MLRPQTRGGLLPELDPSVPTCEGFSPDVCRQLAQEIAAAGGNEVFFLGKLEDGKLTQAEAVARGDSTQVPVFMERAADFHVLIHNHPSADLTPSPADLSVASEAGERGLGFFIIDNAATRVYRVVEPFPRKELVLLDEDEIAAIFSPGGLLSTVVPSFEDRTGQRQLAVEVARAFNNRSVVAYEAGTGVGKSFAYLVPAILWAVRNRSRVVVSTQTIALGEQLIGKDLPQLQRVLEVPFSYALIKGRSNYACRRKSGEVQRQRELFVDDDSKANWVEEILEHLERSDEGSLSDLPRLPPPEVWSDFESTTQQSLKTRCPHYRECYYYEARRRAFQAHLVVVNHHLFFADLAMRRAADHYDGNLVLPAYKRVIFDEAHRVEDVACQHMGVRFSRAGVLQVLGRMVSPSRKKGGRERGRFPYLATLLRRGAATIALEFLEMELIPQVRDTREQSGELFDELQERIAAAGEVEGGADPVPDMVRVGERPGDLSPDVVDGPLNRLREQLLGLQAQVRQGWNRALDHPFEPEEEFQGALAEYRNAFRSLGDLIAAIDLFLNPGTGMLAWVELDPNRQKRVALQVAPVRVSKILGETLYTPADSVVMTSATLSVAGKWDFLGDRLGWSLTEEGRFRGEHFSSPFDYRQQTLLALPSDLPPPNTAGFEAAFADMLQEILLAVRGRTFVLFTAHSMLRSVARRIGATLLEANLPLLVQGNAPQSELLARFRSAGNAVLLGNQSFWEGVDVPGEALSCVVIARLPFKVPTHPLERGRHEELTELGMSPFMKLSVPQAALALKQGFGRLIRTRQDRGVVVIADTRITSRPYGRIFLNSLPPCERLQGDQQQVLQRIQKFFELDPEFGRG